MIEAVVSYFSNTYAPIVSYTVDQSFFHRQIVPILDPGISEIFLKKLFFTTMKDNEENTCNLCKKKFNLIK